ncbi:MFS transporter [Gammaproteobacteria bacterium]|nr:MFS transporter [Gammaproteobacteria bacterium]
MAIILPQVSESILGPCLFAIATDFNITIEQAEHAYSFYLFGYAIGMLIWGVVLDRYGSRSAMQLGLLSYTLGSLLCMFSQTAWLFMFARILQGLGGSVCTVCAYVLCRLCFEGQERVKMQANLSIALAVGPALGPILGQLVAVHAWQWIYIPLLLQVVILLLLQYSMQIDTPKGDLNFGAFRTYFSDLKLWIAALIIGSACGIGFTFFAEGPYLMMTGLGMSEHAYASCFIYIGLAWYLGGCYAKYLSTRQLVPKTITKGIITCLALSFILSYILYFHPSFVYILPLTWLCIILIMTFNSLIIGNSIGLILSQYTEHIGTITSILGFLYYIVMSCSTVIMALIHDGSLIAMPVLWWKMFILAGIGHYLLHYSSFFAEKTR